MSFIVKLAICFSIACSASAAETHPTIMVSIKPFYNLCARVMQSVGKPELLLQNNASPHDYQLKPSDIQKIQLADLIIWGGPDLEGFLQKPIANARNSQDLNLSKISNLKLLPMRTSTDWHAHDNDGHHHHGNYDSHFWLDPDNAIIIAKAIARRLGELDPAHADTYIKNAKDFAHEIKKQNPIWQQQLAAVKNTPFIVFHDAYQYLDLYFGLNGVGSISLNPEIPPSAQRIAQIQNLLNQKHVSCIFSEPQFNNKIIITLTEGLNIHRGILDPLGQDKDIGPNGYIVLINNLVASLQECK